jgi:hypothetical protein
MIMRAICRTRLSQATLLSVALLAGGCGHPASPEDAEALRNLPADTRSIAARRLSDDAIPALVRFKHLSFLSFRLGRGGTDARISDVGLSRLAQLDLPTLTWLDLASCQNVTDVGLKHVAEIESLERLALNACQGITDEGLRHLATMDHLQLLDLRGCQGISDIGLEELAVMTNLRWLRLGGCENVSEEAVGKLQRVLPNCNVGKDDTEWSQHTPIPKLHPVTLLVGGAIMLIGLLSAIIYIPIQVLAVRKLKGGLRIAAIVPIPIMVLVLGITVEAYLAESNLWWYYMILLSPIAAIFLAALLIAGRVLTRREGGSTA